MRYRTGFGLAVAAAVFMAGGAVAHAKGGQSWVLSGGDLGSSAYYFSAPEGGDGDDLLSTAVALGAGSCGTGAFELYPAGASPDAVASQVSLGRPDFRYSPEEGVLCRWSSGPPGDRFRLPAEQRAMLDGAVADAERLKLQGGLLDSPVHAHFQALGLDHATYTFVNAGSLASLGPRDSSSFADALERALSGPYARTEAPPGEAIRITVSVVWGGEAWGGDLGYYLPPRGEAPGRLWISIGPAVPFRYTTPGFDAAIPASVLVHHAESSGASGSGTSDLPSGYTRVHEASASTIWIIFGTPFLAAFLGLATVLLGRRRRSPGR